MKASAWGAAIGALACIQGASLPIAMAATDPFAMTAADFLDVCTRRDMHWVDFCHGYVQAVYDSGFSIKGKVCLPDGITRASLVEQIVSMPVPNSEVVRSTPAAALVRVALISRYPCP